jgi:hypothetical protein
MKELDEMKAKLSSLNHTVERTVDLWNEMREEFKLKYSAQAINDLDASGYITKWLKFE